MVFTLIAVSHSSSCRSLMYIATLAYIHLALKKSSRQPWSSAKATFDFRIICYLLTCYSKLCNSLTKNQQPPTPHWLQSFFRLFHSPPLLGAHTCMACRWMKRWTVFFQYFCLLSNTLAASPPSCWNRLNLQDLETWYWYSSSIWPPNILGPTTRIFLALMIT